MPPPRPCPDLIALPLFLRGIVCGGWSCGSVLRRVASHGGLLGMDQPFLTAMDEASIGPMLSADRQL